MAARIWTRMCGIITFTALASIAGCPDTDDDARTAESGNRSSGQNDAGGAAGGSQSDRGGATDPAGSADAADGPGDSPGGGAGGDGAPAGGGEGGSLGGFVAPLEQQLADRFFELGTSSISGSNSITGVLKLSLCGFGNARVVEQTIFSGSTPDVDLGFDSETITEGVWSVVDARDFIALEVREFAPAGAQGELLKRFSVEFDAQGNLLGIDGRQILSTDDIAATCRQAQQEQQLLDQALADLTNKRAVLTSGADRGEVVLCENGDYGFKATSNGQVFILEGGRWSIELAQSGLELVLVSDPAFDANGQTFTTRLAIARNASGAVILGGNATTLAAIAGNCDTAIQTLLQ